jgi:hypothetical protein
LAYVSLKNDVFIEAVLVLYVGIKVVPASTAMTHMR